MFSQLFLSFLFVIPAVVAANSKRGLCFAQSNGNDISQAENSRTSWIYNWGTSPPSYLQNTGMTYIPMQWGTAGADSFQSTVLSQGAKTVLGFNEPDLSSQSNVDPATAASVWKQYIQPLHNYGVRLGAPAVTNGPMGTPWLSQFLANCTGCTIDFIPLHWYGDGIGNFYDYIWSFHGQFPNYPLWVTEWASTNSDPSVANDFLNQTTTYLDSLDWIQGYSWFAFFRDDGTNQFSLMNSDGSLNTRGHTYLGK